MKPRVGILGWLLGALCIIALIWVVFGGAKEPITPPIPAQTDVLVPTNVSKEDIFGKDGNAIEETRETRKNFGEIVKPFEPVTSIVKEVVPPPVKITISEEEIFKRLFTSRYLQVLDDLQGDFITIGWMPAGNKRSLNNTENVLAFLKDNVEIMISKNFYAADQIAFVRDAISVNYPKLVEAKRREIIQQAVKTRLYPFARDIDGKSESLSWQFFPDALAFGLLNIPGIWETSPTCFKGLNPQQTLVGKDIDSMQCCNCGCKIDGYYCRPVLDCGPFAGENGNTALCDLHFGCLNKDCEGFNNAIWDGRDALTTENFGKLTNKCGCDDPQKAQGGGGGGGAGGGGAGAGG